MYALIDCNNFYVSCERAFNPCLENKPVIVLSNNDGCIISRSNEAKKLGIPMGAPFFKWQAFCEHHKIAVFSSNYELYGDMSQRVMALLKNFNEETEIYSIDEAFLLLNPAIHLDDLHVLRNAVKIHTGIPISIGVGPTKTLSKVANQLAKGNESGVFHLIDQQDDYLADFPVEKIWGIGHRLAARLKKLNITTAKQLRDAPEKLLRLHFSVTVEKTCQELKGIACLNLESPVARKQIVSSRSFGKKVSALNELEEAISHYMHIATTKLRKQHGVAAAVYVFLQTNIFKDQPQYANGVTYPLPTPSADTAYLIRIAKKCLHHIYQKDFVYHKAGVMLMDISPDTIRQQDLFLTFNDEKSKNRMSIMDHINKNMGKNTLYFASEGLAQKRNWMIKFNRLSKRYTTRWNELPIVKC